MRTLNLIFLLASIFSIAQAQDNHKLYVFVGEKISIEPFDANKKEEVSPGVFKVTISMDNAYKAKYKVLENIYGNYVGDTIEFDVYDHYGKPSFSSYENVLLFVSEHNGELYHEKYQYFDIYRTEDGGWASPGDPYRFEPEVHRKDISFKQVKFKKPVRIDLVNRRKKGIANATQLEEMYNAPWFEIKNRKAVAHKGIEVRDLLQVKKNGVLKARGLF